MRPDELMLDPEEEPAGEALCCCWPDMTAGGVSGILSDSGVFCWVGELGAGKPGSRRWDWWWPGGGGGNAMADGANGAGRRGIGALVGP